MFDQRAQEKTIQSEGMQAVLIWMGMGGGSTTLCADKLIGCSKSFHSIQ